MRYLGSTNCMARWDLFQASMRGRRSAPRPASASTTRATQATCAPTPRSRSPPAAPPWSRSGRRPGPGRTGSRGRPPPTRPSERRSARHPGSTTFSQTCLPPMARTPDPHLRRWSSCCAGGSSRSASAAMSRCSGQIQAAADVGNSVAVKRMRAAARSVPAVTRFHGCSFSSRGFGPSSRSPTQATRSVQVTASSTGPTKRPTTPKASTPPRTPEMMSRNGRSAPFLMRIGAKHVVERHGDDREHEQHGAPAGRPGRVEPDCRRRDHQEGAELGDAEDEDDGGEESRVGNAGEREPQPGEQGLGERGHHDPEGHRPHRLGGEAPRALARSPARRRRKRRTPFPADSPRSRGCPR